MEQENRIPDLYEREEQCQKAMKTVGKAIVMRLVVAALMVWAVFLVPGQPVVWGLMAFVLIIDVLGTLPLIQEWRKQKSLFDSLVDQEEK